MRALLCILLIALSLPAAALADVPIDLYVGTTGNDTNNDCQQANAPCRTLQHALAKTFPGTTNIVKIARGNYQEKATLYIPSRHAIIFEGGWNADFTGHTCNPAGTIIIAAANSSGRQILFRAHANGTGQRVNMTLRCLTLKKNSNSQSYEAIAFSADAGSIGLLSLDYMQIIGFNYDTLSVGSWNNSTVTATIAHSLFNDNTGNYPIIDIFANSGIMTLNINHVLLRHNDTASTGHSILGISTFGTGKINASIQNTIIADNQVGNASPFSVESQANSTISLKSTNNTITDNTSSRGNGYGFSALTFNSSKITLNLYNTILRDNHGTSLDKEIYFQQSDTAILSFTADYCMLGTHSSLGTINYNSLNAVYGNPHLNTIYHLHPGSPAIDAGICGYWDQSLSYQRIAPDDDIDGDKRPGPGTYLGCDIGADEYKPFPWPMFLPAIDHQRGNP